MLLNSAECTTVKHDKYFKQYIPCCWLQLLQTTPLLLHLHSQLLLLPAQVDCVNRLRTSSIALIVEHVKVEHDDYSTSILLLIAAPPNHPPSPTRHALPTPVVASSGSLIVLFISITVEHDA